jgi:apolipoprotein N-acyltransferase
VGIAQGNQPAKSRKLAGATYRRITDDLRDQHVDLVVWPEGALWQVYPEASYREDLRAAVTGGLGVPTVFGSGVVREVAGRKRETNSAFLADANGEIVGRYDKVNLVPFGEHVPLADTFPGLRDVVPNASHLLRGESLTPLVLGDRRLAALICVEDMMPSFVNRMVSATDPDLLVNLTIDTWFGNTAEPWAHLAIAEMRAIEHRRFLVRASNTGVSAVIDPVGRRVAVSGVFTEETLVAEVRWLRGKTVYEVLGDAPMWLVTAASLAMAFRARRKAPAVTPDRPSSAA